MIRQKIKASARMLGVGLLALAVSAPGAMAQAKKTLCPFTSKDIDGWYKAVGFDTGADDAGRGSVVCTVDPEATYATLSEVELAQFGKPDPLDPDATVVGVRTGKGILIDVQWAGGNSFFFGKYSTEVIRDGISVPEAENIDVPFTAAGQYAACVSALTSSQAWKRWACSKQ